MTNPDRRVHDSTQLNDNIVNDIDNEIDSEIDSDASSDESDLHQVASDTANNEASGFFVDITPPEFGEEGAADAPPPAIACSAPNVPGESSFVERRARPMVTNEAGGLFSQGSEIPATAGETEVVVDPNPTDEIPVLPDPLPALVEKPGTGPEDQQAEMTSADFGAGSLEQPKPKLETWVHSDTEEAPSSSTANVNQPSEDDRASTEPAEPIGIESENSTESQCGEGNQIEMTPAQIQLAEMRAMLAKISRQSHPAASGAKRANEPTTDDHPIVADLQAELAAKGTREVDETLNQSASSSSASENGVSNNGVSNRSASDTGAWTDPDLQMGDHEQRQEEPRRPKRPPSRRSLQQVVDHGGGVYDYDHEYYAANRNAHPDGGPSPVDSPSNDTSGSARRTASPGRMERQSRDQSGVQELATQQSGRVADTSDRRRVGRLLLMLCVAVVVGGAIWAASSGLI